MPLGIVEILVATPAYDADAKLRRHWSDDVRYEYPANVTADIAALIGKQSVALHRAIKCRGYSRIDWRLSHDGTPLFLELNTNPGLSRKGNFALSALAVGLTYEDLILMMSATGWLTGT